MRKPFAYSKKVFLSKKKQVLCLQPLPQITASLPGLNQPPAHHCRKTNQQRENGNNSKYFIMCSIIATTTYHSITLGPQPAITIGK